MEAVWLLERGHGAVAQRPRWSCACCSSPGPGKPQAPTFPGAATHFPPKAEGRGFGWIDLSPSSLCPLRMG